jgi:hypothetical protein
MKTVITGIVPVSSVLAWTFPKHGVTILVPSVGEERYNYLDATLSGYDGKIERWIEERRQQANQPRNGAGFAITDVRVFDGERVWPTATVVVESDRIAYVGESRPTELPDVVIDGQGMTLLPGLIDAHVHTRAPEADLRDALRFGVTTVLEMVVDHEVAAHIPALLPPCGGGTSTPRLGVGYRFP